jgi:O-ureido-D-serine cyclo-ligase
VPPTVALVTAVAARDLDDDLAPLARALGDLDVAHEVASWDDDHVDWGRYDLAVVRSTWDYVTRRDAFLAWVDRTAAVTALRNPPAVLRWNTDKQYLRDLAAAGVAVVDTRFFQPGAVVAPGALAFDGADVVVKPAVSAGSRDTARYAPADLAAAAGHAQALVDRGRVVMVQPYLDAVDDVGETSAVYVGGALSHGLRKDALLDRGGGLVDGLFAMENMGPRRTSPAEDALAVAALAAVGTIVGADVLPLLYARVDSVPGPDGEPLLLELELTEPSLFHAYAPGSAATFASAIARTLAAL